jgi:hypothetical protein
VVIAISFTGDAQTNKTRNSNVAATSHILYDDFASNNYTIWQKTYTTFGPQGNVMLRKNVQVASGLLTISSDISFHTGGIRSTKSQYSHGMYCASMKLDVKPNSLLELDMGSDSDGIYMKFENVSGTHYVYLATVANNMENLYKYRLPFSPGTAFHTYGFNWNGDHVDFLIDSDKVWSSATYVPVKPGNIVFKSWVQSDASARTRTISKMYVDWLRVDPILPNLF